MLGMEGTVGVDCGRVSEEYTGEHKGLVDGVLGMKIRVQDLEDAGNPNEVQTDSVDVDTLQKKESHDIADVDRVQADVMNGEIPDEALKSSLDGDKDQTLDRMSGQDKRLEVGLPEVLDRPVDADNVQEGLLKGDWKRPIDEMLNEAQSQSSLDITRFVGGDLNKAVEKVPEISVLNAQTWMNSMRCQVKITTRHSLQLHMANHTARDVYVRLLHHGDRISGNGTKASRVAYIITRMIMIMILFIISRNSDCTPALSLISLV